MTSGLDSFFNELLPTKLLTFEIEIFLIDRIVKNILISGCRLQFSTHDENKRVKSMYFCVSAIFSHRV